LTALRHVLPSRLCGDGTRVDDRASGAVAWRVRRTLRSVDGEGLYQATVLPLEHDDAADGAALRERGYDQDVAVAVQLAGNAIRRARWTGYPGKGRCMSCVRRAAEGDGVLEEPEPDVGVAVVRETVGAKVDPGMRLRPAGPRVHGVGGGEGVRDLVFVRHRPAGVSPGADVIDVLGAARRVDGDAGRVCDQVGKAGRLE